MNHRSPYQPNHHRVSRRRFLAALAAMASTSAYALGMHMLPLAPFIRQQQQAAANEPSTDPVTDGQITVVEHYPGAPGERTRKNLPPKKLVIPSIELSTPVVPIGIRYDGRGQAIWETAAFVAGHYTNTANPGENGNCVIAGHISSPNAGAIFKRLPDVAVGSGVAVASEESLFLYEVADARVVNPRETAVMFPGTGSKLTLITCVPDGIYSHRLIVTALPI